MAVGVSFQIGSWRNGKADELGAIQQQPYPIERRMALQATAEEQISAFLKNNSGVVADVCAALTERKVNILAVTVLDTVDIGTLRLIVDDVGTAKEALREAGAAFVVIPVIAVSIPNKPGAFARVVRTIAQAGINIEYFYATAIAGVDRSLGIFRVSDQEKALQIEFQD